MSQLRSRFDRAIDELPWDGEEGRYFGTTLDTADAIAELDLPLDEQAHEQLLGDLEDDLWARNVDFYPAPSIDEVLGKRPPDAVLLEQAWQRFAHRVMHETRYFSAATWREEAPSFSKLGWGVGQGEELPSIAEGLKSAGKLARRDAGLSLYRARAFFDEAHQEAAALSSPPSDKARQGRINAAGVSIFYGAVDPQTAAAEAFDRSPFVSVARFGMLPVTPDPNTLYFEREEI